MRRPLFGNGIPRNINFGDPFTEVFNTSALSADPVFALTLYLWWFQPGPAPRTNPSLFIRVVSDGGPPKPIANYPDVFLDTIWVGPAVGNQIAPLKVLDRYMVRGDQQVLVDNAAAGASCFIWGYFEQVGEVSAPRPFRGLQPAALVDPFSYEPVFIIAGGPGSISVPLHQLSPTHIDEVTLDVALQTGSDTSGSVITLPGGVLLPLPSEPSGVRFRVFDGIPMRAPSAADTTIGVGVLTVGFETVAALAAYGSFDRH